MTRPFPYGVQSVSLVGFYYFLITFSLITLTGSASAPVFEAITAALAFPVRTYL